MGADRPGYAGAIRAGQLGKRVACVEPERDGGTCLNWGCIPSKALLKADELHDRIHHTEEFGIRVEGVQVDFKAVMKRSRTDADRMARGVEFLLKKNKVTYLRGHGSIPRRARW